MDHQAPTKKGLSTLLLAAFLAAFGAVACLPTEEAPAVQQLDDSVEGSLQPRHLSGLPRDGTPAAVGALVVAADCRVTAEILAVEAGLYPHAARAIVEARAGADGLCGTADDGRFRALGDLLALERVGPRNVERLVRLAEEVGAEPAFSGGTVDGVPFSDGQAWHTLRAANGASFEVLDGQAGLRADAARNIVEARPILTLGQLRDVHRVGPMTLERLRDWASPRHATAVVLDAAALERLLPLAESRFLDEARFTWDLEELADGDADLEEAIRVALVAELEGSIAAELSGLAYTHEEDAFGAILDVAASIKRAVRIDGWSYLAGTLGL